jgi:pimeloyl-ACP methyl ester carboxylesterase
VQTDVLDIAYEEHGAAAGTAVILLHGFPYDVRSFDGVVQPLVAAGHRVLVPWLRGYGPTRFRDSSAPRMAEQAALAQDVIDFANALVIGQVSIGGYSVQNTTVRGGAMPARQAAQFWYMWYFNTEQGAAALQANRHDVIRYLWETWSPQWQYTDEAYARSAPSFDNPDFVDVVVHSYRHRLMNAPGDPRFLEMERRLAEQPPIGVPAIVLAPGATGLGGRPSESPAGDQRRFTNLVARRIVEGAGHDLPAHRPDAVAEALLELVG